MNNPTRQDMLNKIYEKINFPYDDGDAVYSPVMIGDALDWIVENTEPEVLYNTTSVFMTAEFLKTLHYWYFLREPLDKQSDDCISYIYSLL